MTHLDALILGIVQGLTEFLPVSSSGHLVLGQALLGLKQHSIEFDVVVHVATLLAVVVYFRSEVRMLIADSLSALKERPADVMDANQRLVGARLTLLVIAASIPTAIIGLGFEDLFEQLFSSVRAVGGFLLVTSALLWLTWKRGGEESSAPRYETLNVRRALVIGLAQGAAIAPGVSRSGSTIASALLCGVERRSAASFSFLISIPAILGAVVVRADELGAIPADQYGVLALGFASALISGLCGLWFLMRIVNRGGLYLFGFYTAAVGIAALILG
ncbi:MAG: undecaprenyl-diphosphate phosphatase [Chrysiogenetes bacterium]|nr:undecaprenyl-diphosphate phosphatase [Chrysiogenetes bacterium]